MAKSKRTMAPADVTDNDFVDEPGAEADKLEQEVCQAIQSELGDQVDWNALDGDVLVKEMAGTWDKRPGNTITGTISHCYEYRTKERPGQPSRTCVGLALVVDRPTRCKTDFGSEVVPPGSVVGFTLTKKLEGLLSYQLNSWVAVQFLGMVEFAAGQDVGKYNVKVIGKKRPGGANLKPTTEVDIPVDYEEDGTAGL